MASAPAPAPAPPAQAPAPPPAAPPSQPNADTGRVLYQTHCLGCHGIQPDSVSSVAGDPEEILRLISFVAPMNSLASVIRLEQAEHIALWLQDPR